LGKLWSAFISLEWLITEGQIGKLEFIQVTLFNW
jgi:hypothetical protein